MNRYHWWNEAIIEFFTRNLGEGSAVYLSFDEDVAAAICEESGESPEGGPLEDFLQAVRIRTVTASGGVDLEGVSATDEFGRPECVAFLCSMVLAAYRMAPEEQKGGAVDESDYFVRLRQVLSLPSGRGRPAGMKPPGIEEPLWKMWNRWLQIMGFVPTAEGGEGAWKFIAYPISQTILRDGDKARLEEFFLEREAAGALSRFWDRWALAAWLRNPSNVPSRKHLREHVGGDNRRFEVFVDASFEIFSTAPWGERRLAGGHPHSRRQSSRIYAGLYRTEDVFSGEIRYRIYPRQPSRWKDSPLFVRREAGAPPLEMKQERPGWFRPLWTVNPSGDLTYEIESEDSPIRQLILSPRDFWVLVRDGDDELSGVLASWQAPEPAETFLLLCRSRFEDQLQILSEAKLLKWKERTARELEGETWFEYREVMILSPYWEEINPMDGCEDLISELKPSISATIKLENGLKVPRSSRWLVGYQPELSIFALREPNVILKVKDVEGNEVFEDLVETNNTYSLNSLPEGNYVAEAWAETLCLARRSFRLVSWNALEERQPSDPISYRVGTLSLRGPILEETGAVRDPGE